MSKSGGPPTRREINLWLVRSNFLESRKKKSGIDDVKRQICLIWKSIGYLVQVLDPPDPMRPIESIPFNKRITKGLHSIGIKTARQLEHTPAKDLLKARGIGRASLREINVAMFECGYSLWMWHQ